MEPLLQNIRSQGRLPREVMLREQEGDGMAGSGNATHSIDRDWLRLWAQVLMALILAGWALRALSPITIPIVFSFFLALVVAPVERWVSQHVSHRLRWLGHGAAMSVIVIVLVVFVGCLWLSAQQVVGRFSGGLASLLPEVSGEGDQAEAGAGTGEAALTSLLEALRAAGGSFAERLTDWASSAAGTVAATLGSLVSAAVLVFFLTLLMLVEAPRWRAKIATLIDASSREDTFEAIGVIAQRLRRYLLVRLVLGLLTAMLYVGWLWLFGLDLLLVWGLLTVMLNFLPTIGSLISGILPVLYAFVTKDPWTAVIIGAGILLIEQVMGNYVDPVVQGRQISLSPLVVLVVLMFWGWIWGIAGAVLAVPITITLLVFAAHVRGLRGLALLISNETDLEGVDRIASR